MRKVLLVDDDPLILKIYQEGLARHGFQVDTAADGLAAVQTLRADRPDVVILDLMMPKLSGVDVLKFIRSRADLAKLPVVVVSNVYLSELAEQAMAIGVQKAVLKTRCSPSVLANTINELLPGDHTPKAAESLPSPPPASAPPPPPPSLPPPPPSRPPTVAPVRGRAAGVDTVTPTKTTKTETFSKQRLSFLGHAPRTCAGIRTNCKAFVSTTDATVRAARFEDFYRKVRFLTATAGFAQFHHIALLGSAFEALLFELREKPALLTSSVLRTMVFTVDFFGELCDRARETTGDVEFSSRVLVVDDDPISNRVVVRALLRAHLPATSTESPTAALQMLREQHHDLLLFDVEMPGMDGFELCKQVRALPGYQRVPVIYVTVHADFEHRAKSVLSGGNDLIAKPVLPIELAVKAVTHLLKSQLAESKM
jgi:CheY-like chemotaxis protein